MHTAQSAVYDQIDLIYEGITTAVYAVAMCYGAYATKLT